MDNEPPSLQDIHQQLGSIQTDLKEALKQKAKPPKDWLDKLSAISTLLSGVILSAIIWFATYQHNERQLATAQAQTVAPLIPHLSSKDEQVKEGALQALVSMGNPQLAIRLAIAFRGSGRASRAVLGRMTSSSDPQVATQSKQAIEELNRALTTDIVDTRESLLFENRRRYCASNRSPRDKEKARITFQTIWGK